VSIVDKWVKEKDLEDIPGCKLRLFAWRWKKRKPQNTKFYVNEQNGLLSSHGQVDAKW